jgi:hypothetical protein
VMPDSWCACGTGSVVLEPGLVGTHPGPEVGLGAVTNLRCPPQSEVVVYRMAESLLAAEIPLSCLNRYEPKQKLNLLKLSACQVT